MSDLNNLYDLNDLNDRRPQTSHARDRHDQGNARSSVVNRTHRVIREQAATMQEQKKRSRSLYVPLLISSLLLLVICYAIWGVMANYDLTPTGVPDASDQVLLLLLWSLPITVVVLGLIWLRRSRGRNGSGEQAL